MAKKEQTGRTSAPFGVTSKRFDSIGFHPGLDKQGTMKKDKGKLGPGQYNPELPECIYKKYNVGGSSWKRKADLELWCINLGYRNAQILKDRRFEKTMKGPGCYEISEETFKRQSGSCMHNVGFGRQKRFWNPIKYSTPPPGTYGKDITKPSATGNKQFSNLPSFEWDGFIDRFKDHNPPYTKPPNLYNPKDHGSIDALLAKMVSKRGPYDLFTGPRDGSTIKNKFAPSSFKGPQNWIYTWPSHLEHLLYHPSKQKNGRFFKEGRFGKPTQYHMLIDPVLAFRDPSEPSPCHYVLERPREFEQNPYAFNKSVKEARPPTKWIIHPGVGRYSPKFRRCSNVKRETSVFKSKTGRTEYKAIEYSCF